MIFKQIYNKPYKALFITAFALLCLVIYAPTSVSAQEDIASKVFTRGIAIPQAVGMGMAGDKYENPNIKVAFARKPKVSGFLKANNMSLDRVSLSDYKKNKLKGAISYINNLGRSAYYEYNITYKMTGKNQYKVLKRTITPFEPIIPRAEVYFIPAEYMSLKKMKAMSVADLLRWARKNNEKVVPDSNAPSGPVKDYAVLCFNMDRLRPKAKWQIFSEDKIGKSWSKGDWHVAYIKSNMALNGSVAVIFDILHTRGRKSINAGKTLVIAGFTNQYFPPLPPSPMSKIEIPPATKKLLTKYHSKNLPNLKKTQ